MDAQELRQIRGDILEAFDIYKSNVIYGIESETEKEHEEILNWYKAMLDLPEDVEIYQSAPEKIRRYLKKYAK